MKKRIFIIAILSMAILTACNESGKTNDTLENKKDKKQAEKLEINTKTNSDKEDKQTKESEEKKEESKAEIDESEKKKEPEQGVKNEVTISVFYSNDDATAFNADLVKIKELTPENVLNALADKGIVNKDVRINKFEVSEIDGMQSINIDFNQKFKDGIMSCGSTQEYYVIGGICDTFIKAYQADRIKITVDGQCLETGHNDYPDYMFEF